MTMATKGNSSVVSDPPYKQAYDYYVNHVHTPTGIALSVAGLIANSISLAVFTRPAMQTCFNSLLLSLVVVDMVGLVVVCMDQVDFQRYSSKLCRTYGDVVYYYALNFISIFFTGMLNSWLTVFIAVTRYLVVSRLAFILTMKHVKSIVFFSVIISQIHFIPNILVLKINKQKTENQTCYIMSKDYEKYISVNTLTLYNMIFLITPIITLMLVSILLVRVIFKAQRKFYAGRRTNQTNTWSNATRTNVVLLGVSVMSFLSKIPYLILAATHGKVISSNNYLLKTVFIISWRFTVINCGINLVFFLISTDFRKTLISLICRKNETDTTDSVDSTSNVRLKENTLCSVIEIVDDAQRHPESAAPFHPVETSGSETKIRPANNSKEHTHQQCGISGRDAERIGSDTDTTDQIPDTSYQYPDGNDQDADMISREKTDTVGPISDRKKSLFVNAIRSSSSRFQTT